MTLVYHSTGSMTEVPHSVAVETEKKSILRKRRMGDGCLSSETRCHPLGWRWNEIILNSLGSIVQNLMPVATTHKCSVE